MKLTAGVAYRVTSSRYAASEPPSASLASSASLCATDTHYTALAPAPFQIPKPKSQISRPNANLGFGAWDLELGIWGLGFFLWFQQFAGGGLRKARGVIRRLVGNGQAIEIALCIDRRHAAR